MNDIFYVYIHVRLDSGLPFYVGKGQDNRAWSKNRSNNHWRYIVNKHGYSVNIAQDGMAERDAFLLEMWLIAKLRHDGYDLCNMTDGGDGPSGLIHTDESRAKMSASATGRIMPDHVKLFLSERWKGDFNPSKNMSDGHRQSISDRMKGVVRRAESNNKTSESMLGDKNHFYGKHHSTETKEKISKTKGSGVIYTIIAPNGSKIVGTIASICFGNKIFSDGIRRMVKGEFNQYLGFTLDGHEKNPRANSKIVFCSNGMKFDSLTEAMNWLTVNGFPLAARSNIDRCCVGKTKKAYGYSWSYTE